MFTKPEVPVAVVPQGGDPVPGAIDPSLLPPTQVGLAWPLGELVSMHVHLSASPNADLSSENRTSDAWGGQDEGLPSFVWRNITFGDWSETRVAHYDIDIPEVREFLLSCWDVGSDGSWVP